MKKITLLLAVLLGLGAVPCLHAQLVATAALSSNTLGATVPLITMPSNGTAVSLTGNTTGPISCTTYPQITVFATRNGVNLDVVDLHPSAGLSSWTGYPNTVALQVNDVLFAELTMAGVGCSNFPPVSLRFTYLLAGGICYANPSACVTLGGVFAGPNGMAAPNYSLSFRPNQTAYIAGAAAPSVLPGLVLAGILSVQSSPGNAVCDGVTDDTGNIQTALNYASANGIGIVVVPSGKTCVESSVNVPAGMVFMGYGATLLQTPATYSQSLVQITSVTGVAVEGFALDGNIASSLGGPQSGGVNINASKNVSVRDITVQNMPRIGVNIHNGSDGVTVDNERFSGTLGNSALSGTDGLFEAVEVTGGLGAISNDVALRNIILSPSSYYGIGFQVSGVTKFTAENIESDNSVISNGGTFEHIIGGSITNAVAKGNYANGFEITGNVGTKHTNVTATGNGHIQIISGVPTNIGAGILTGACLCSEYAGAPFLPSNVIFDNLNTSGNNTNGQFGVKGDAIQNTRFENSTMPDGFQFDGDCNGTLSGSSCVGSPGTWIDSGNVTVEDSTIGYAANLIGKGGLISGFRFINDVLGVPVSGVSANYSVWTDGTYTASGDPFTVNGNAITDVIARLNGVSGQTGDLLDICPTGAGTCGGLYPFLIDGSGTPIINGPYQTAGTASTTSPLTAPSFSTADMLYVNPATSSGSINGPAYVMKNSAGTSEIGVAEQQHVFSNTAGAELTGMEFWCRVAGSLTVCGDFLYSGVLNTPSGFSTGGMTWTQVQALRTPYSTNIAAYSTNSTVGACGTAGAGAWAFYNSGTNTWTCPF